MRNSAPHHSHAVTTPIRPALRKKRVTICESTSPAHRQPSAVARPRPDADPNHGRRRRGPAQAQVDPRSACAVARSRPPGAHRARADGLPSPRAPSRARRGPSSRRSRRPVVDAWRPEPAAGSSCRNRSARAASSSGDRSAPSSSAGRQAIRLDDRKPVSGSALRARTTAMPGEAQFPCSRRLGPRRTRPSFLGGSGLHGVARGGSRNRESTPAAVFLGIGRKIRAFYRQVGVRGRDDLIPRKKAGGVLAPAYSGPVHRESKDSLGVYVRPIQVYAQGCTGCTSVGRRDHDDLAASATRRSSRRTIFVARSRSWRRARTWTGSAPRRSVRSVG